MDYIFIFLFITYVPVLHIKSLTYGQGPKKLLRS